MDKSLYYATLKAMADAGVSNAYYHGWASGALGNPALEEQRVTEGYTAGYEHAQAGVLDGYNDWIEAKAN